MPDFSFMWWRRNLFLLSGKHEYTGMLLTTNNVKWWCSSSASKSFLNPVKCICFWSFQLFNTLKYPYTEVYILLDVVISWRWQMKSGVKDSQGRLPMHRYYSYCAERKKERESSQPLFAVAYMWPKKLWWCGTKSFQISFGQKSFFLLQLLGFPSAFILRNCAEISVSQQLSINWWGSKKPHPEIIGFLLSIMCSRPFLQGQLI